MLGSAWNLIGHHTALGSATSNSYVKDWHSRYIAQEFQRGSVWEGERDEGVGDKR
jgi:hypothetical protein